MKIPVLATVCLVLVAAGCAQTTVQEDPEGTVVLPRDDVVAGEDADPEADVSIPEDLAVPEDTGEEPLPDVADPHDEVAPPDVPEQDLPPPECEDNIDCADQAKPFCLLPGGWCVACLVDVHCDDGDGCNVDACKDGECFYQPGAYPACCNADVECDDGDPCTAGHCTGNACVHDFILGCCKDDIECVDADNCTQDLCVGNVCSNEVIADCCNFDMECDDANSCTTDSCVAQVCQHNLAPGCCTTDEDCEDGNLCTDDSCQGESCVNSVVQGCCIVNNDCDDASDCTTDFCVGNTCENIPIQGCCVGDEDCDDAKFCTIDECNLQTGLCSFSSKSCDDADACSEDECSEAQKTCLHTMTNCDDGDPCTLDSCDPQSGDCINEVSGCCQTDEECDDQDPCTQDSCVGGACNNAGGTCINLEPVQDTWLEGTSNKGGNDFLIVGKTGTFEKKRSLMRFDLSSLPPGAAVVGATLEVYYFASTKPSWEPNEQGIDREIRVHRVLKTWNENQATADKATSNTNWSAKCLAMDGTDAEAQALDSEIWLNQVYEWKSLDVTPAAKAWAADSAQNFGLVVYAANDDVNGMDMRFYSREKSDAALTPRLIVLYEPAQ